jgi:hypothetical protein
MLSLLSMTTALRGGRSRYAAFEGCRASGDQAARRHIEWHLLGSGNPKLARDAARTARDAVASQLKDAGSAEYRNINVFRLPAGNFLVCGEVNARNGFGGMAGFARSVVPGGGLAVIESSMINGSTFNSLWSEIGCDGSNGAAVERDVLVLG